MPTSPRPSSRTATASARTSAGCGSRRRRDEFDDIFADDDAPRAPDGAAALRAAAAGNGRSDVRVHLVIPKSFNDAQQVADKFKDSIPVVLNLQGIETDLSKRLIDFASGLTYALDGGMQRIADKVFMLTPRNVEISAEERARAHRKGLLQPELTPRGRSASSAPGTWPARSRSAGVEPVLCTDVGRPSARRRWPTEVGGEALRVQRRGRAARRPRRPGHKPYQLAPVAAEVGAARQGGRLDPRRRRRWRDVKAAYPDRPVYRVLPNTPVEVRQGAVILAADDEQDAELDAAVRELFEELGTLVVLDDAMVDVAMGLMSNAPAYYALVVEAQVDAGVRHGLTADQASRAGRADDGGHRRAAAPPGLRHAGRAPRGHLAGRLDRPRARRARARRRCAPRSPTRWMRSSSHDRRARHRPRRTSPTTCRRSSTSTRC